MTEVQGGQGARFYRHSNRVPFLVMIFGPVVALAVAVGAGALFGYLEFLAHLVPSEKLLLIVIFLGMGAFAVLLGSVPATFFVAFKGRNTPAVLLMTLVGCVVGLYTAWVFWIKAYLDYCKLNFHWVAAKPTVLWKLLQIIDGGGVWGLGFGEHPKGAFLASIWVMEALAVFGIALRTANKISSKNVFCETCKKWGTTRSLGQIRPINSEKLRGSLLAGDFGILEGAEKSPEGENTWNEIVLEGCTSCDNLQTLTIERSQLERQGKRSKVKTKKVIRRMMLTPEQTVAVAQIAGTVKGGGGSGGLNVEIGGTAG